MPDRVRPDKASTVRVVIDYVFAVTHTLKVIIFTLRRASFRQSFRESV
ncbi:MAG: hypothetical protein ACP5M0_05775 [Desulfomonilaceae bacterium]